MRKTASWSGPKRVRRIQACGAMIHAPRWRAPLRSSKISPRRGPTRPRLTSDGVTLSNTGRGTAPYKHDHRRLSASPPPMRDLEQDTDAIGDGACAKHLKADIRARGLAGL